MNVLSCKGKPTPVVSWLVNGKEVDGRLEEFGQNIVVSKLTVPQLRREHRNTTYKCRATNTHLIPPLEKTVILDVYRECIFGVLLSSWPKRIFVDAKTASIYCSFRWCKMSPYPYQSVRKELVCSLEFFSFLTLLRTRMYMWADFIYVFNTYLTFICV